MTANHVDLAVSGDYLCQGANPLSQHFEDQGKENNSRNDRHLLLLVYTILPLKCLETVVDQLIWRRGVTLPWHSKEVHVPSNSHDNQRMFEESKGEIGTRVSHWHQGICSVDWWHKQGIDSTTKDLYVDQPVFPLVDVQLKNYDGTFWIEDVKVFQLEVGSHSIRFPKNRMSRLCGYGFEQNIVPLSQKRRKLKRGFRRIGPTRVTLQIWCSRVDWLCQCERPQYVSPQVKAQLVWKYRHSHHLTY